PGRASRQTAHRFAAGICRPGIWRRENGAMKCDSIEVRPEQLASRRSKLIHAPSTRFTAGSPAQMPDADGEVKTAAYPHTARDVLGIAIQRPPLVSFFICGESNDQNVATASGQSELLPVYHAL
ncbi:MAG: hypothetical protein ACT6SF_20250, partial [Hydrogenophaga sp.]|uniref:hypothetical protein n=1 Tax=Hydrogenophaga sp. TaxID=1904254 RepID=UPI004035ED4D